MWTEKDIILIVFELVTEEQKSDYLYIVFRQKRVGYKESRYPGGTGM